MRLITFGCSLSRQGSLSVNNPQGDKYGGLGSPGLVPSLAEFLEVEYINYAISACSNYYSLERFQNYYITDYHPDDIIVFQLTSVLRQGLSVRPANYTKFPVSKSENVMYDQGSFNYAITYDDAYLKCNNSNTNYNVHLLSNSKILGDISRITSRHGRINPNEQYAKLVSTFHLLHKTHKRFLVWLGWHDALEGLGGNYHKHYKKYLNDNHIPNFLSTPYVEWCAKRKLLFSDDSHPDPITSGRKYAEKVLFPKIKTLL